MRRVRAAWICLSAISVALLACNGSEPRPEVSTPPPSPSTRPAPPMAPLAGVWIPPANVEQGDCWVRWRPLTSDERALTKREVARRDNGWSVTHLNAFTSHVEEMTCRRDCYRVNAASSSEEIRQANVAALWVNADLFGLSPADVQRVEWNVPADFAETAATRPSGRIDGSIRCASEAASQLRGESECWQVKVFYDKGWIDRLQVRMTGPSVTPCLSPTVTMDQARRSVEVSSGPPRVGPGPRATTNRVRYAQLELLSQQDDAGLLWQLVWRVELEHRRKNVYLDAVTGEQVHLRNAVTDCGWGDFPSQPPRR